MVTFRDHRGQYNPTNGKGLADPELKARIEKAQTFCKDDVVSGPYGHGVRQGVVKFVDERTGTLDIKFDGVADQKRVVATQVTFLRRNNPVAT